MKFIINIDAGSLTFKQFLEAVELTIQEYDCPDLEIEEDIEIVLSVPKD